MVESPIEQFWSLGRDLQEESTFRAAIGKLLKEFRMTLDESSPLAKSIDNDDPPRTKAIIANQENFPDLAEILFLDTLEGDSRKAERRATLCRREDERRKAVSIAETNKREKFRRAEARRNPTTDRRAIR